MTDTSIYLVGVPINNYRFEVAMSYTEAEDNSGFYSDRFASYSTWESPDILELLKLDSSGNIIWLYEAEESTVTRSTDLITTSDGVTVLLWHKENWTPSDPPMYTEPSKLIKVSSNGETEWEHTFSSPHTKIAISIFKAGNGDIIGVGYEDWYESPYDVFLGWLFRITEEGEPLWERTIIDERFFTSPMTLRHGLELENGDLMFTGVVWDTLGDGLFTPNTWVIRTDSMGCINPGCGRLDIVTNSEAPTFYPANHIDLFPNPTSGQLFLQTRENISSPLRITILDALGKIMLQQQMGTSLLEIDITPFHQASIS